MALGNPSALLKTCSAGYVVVFRNAQKIVQWNLYSENSSLTKASVCYAMLVKCKLSAGYNIIKKLKLIKSLKQVIELQVKYKFGMIVS